MGSFNPGLKIMENMKNMEKMENINHMIQTTLFMIHNILISNQTAQNTLFYIIIATVEKSKYDPCLAQDWRTSSEM